MTISAICQVREGSGSYASTDGGVDVTPGSTLTIRLSDAAGADIWQVSCVGTDELHSADTVSASIVIDLVTKTATMPAPATAGSAFIIRSWVKNAGNGAEASATFKIATLTSAGLRVGAANEVFETDPEHGTVALLNTLIRLYSGSTPTVPLAIAPTTATLAPGATQTFSASGGTGPYTFSVVNDLADGSKVNASTGVATAGPGDLSSSTTCTVRVTDSLGAHADAVVTVSALFTLVPGAKRALAADHGLTPATMSAVHSFGTSPPTVTVSGTPNGLYALTWRISTGGALGVAKFDWSIDGGETWAATGVTTGASVALGATGITLSFASGTYYGPGFGNNYYVSNTKVSVVSDQSGSSNDATQTSDTPRLLYVPNKRGARPSLSDAGIGTFGQSISEQFGTCGMAVANSIAVPCTVVHVGRKWSDKSNSLGIFMTTGTGGTNLCGYAGTTAPGKWGTYAGATSAHSASSTSIRVARVGATTTRLRTDGGADESFTTSVNGNTPALGAWASSGSLCVYGDIHEEIVWDRVLTDDEVAIVERREAAKWRTNLVACDGNSITDGVGSSCRSQSYPGQMQRILGRANVHVVNAGKPANQTPAIDSAAPLGVDGLLTTGPLGNKSQILIFFEARNHIVLGGVSAATAITAVQTYLTNRVAAGWTVIAVTVPPSNSLAEADRTAVNNWIKANAVSTCGCTAVVDIDTTALGGATGHLNAENYVDQVHMTDAGYLILAQAIAPVVAPLLALAA